MAKMKYLSMCPVWAGLAALLLSGVVANAQGPVREGLRRTGEAAATGTRAAVQGSRQAIGRAGEATRNSVNSTMDAARAQVNRADRSELQIRGSEPMLDPTADVNANANYGAGQIQADAGLNGYPQYNDEGQIDGQNVDGRYESGFRGVQNQGELGQQSEYQGNSFQQGSMVEHNGRMHSVRFSRDGRPYICVNGCPMYLDHHSASAQPHQAYRVNSDRSIQSDGQHVQHDAQSWESNRQIEQGQQFQGQQQFRQDRIQNDSTFVPQGGPGAPPAPPAPMRNDFNSQTRSLNAEGQLDASQRSNLQDSDLRDSANVDVDASSDLQNRNSDANVDASSDASGSRSDQSSTSASSSASAGQSDADVSGASSLDASSSADSDSSDSQSSSSDAEQSQSDSDSTSDSSSSSSSGTRSRLTFREQSGHPI